MIGKILAAFVLLAFLGVIAVGLLGTVSKDMNDSMLLLTSILSGGGVVFLLNLLGLTVRPKYFGTLGILISAALLAYGIYVLVTKQTLIVPVKSDLIPVVGGVATGVGALTLVTSAGIVTL